jgi:hypothetical protein
VIFWNKGKDTIDRSDVAQTYPIHIRALKEAEILDVKILKQNNLSSNFSVELLDGGKVALIDFDYIDEQQGAIFQVIHTGTNYFSVALTGNIKGAKEIDYRTPKRVTRIPTLGIAMYLLMFGFIFVIVFWGDYDIVFKWFLSVFYLITTGFLIFATIRQSKAVAKLPKGLESFEESFFTTPEEK